MAKLYIFQNICHFQSTFNMFSLEKNNVMLPLQNIRKSNTLKYHRSWIIVFNWYENFRSFKSQNFIKNFGVNIIRIFGKCSKERIMCTSDNLCKTINNCLTFHLYKSDYIFINRLGNCLSEQPIRYMIMRNAVSTPLRISHICSDILSQPVQ